jgi:hypothetical protein
MEKGNLLRLPFFEPFALQNVVLRMEFEHYLSRDK